MAKTIMTIDDSASMRQMVSFTLKDADYEVVEAIDGKDALDKLDSAKVHMLLIDLNMPNVDGIELIKQVRAKPELRFITVIMLTTESQSEKKQEGKSAGAMFGFDDISDSAQHVETVLDKVRAGAVPVDKELADLILASRDQISAVLQAAAGGSDVDITRSEQIVAGLKALLRETYRKRSLMITGVILTRSRIT